MSDIGHIVYCSNQESESESLSPLPAQKGGPAGQRPAKCHICTANACRLSTLTTPWCHRLPLALPVHYKVPISGLAHNSYCHIVT